MKIDFESESVVWFFLFVCGCACCWIGIRAKKVETKKQAGILSIFLGICFFVVCILGLFEDFLKATSSIIIIQLIVAGMMLGIYLVMWILGYWKLLRKPRKIFNEDSQTGDLK